MGIPHFHLVAGTVSEEDKVRCWSGPHLRIREYERRWAACDCVAHRISRVWWSITGDSYVVDARLVEGGRDPGDYMAKYLTKGFGQERRMKELGMARRWSSSRGWPGSGRMRLEPTIEDDWRERVYAARALPADLVDRGTFKKMGSSEEMEGYFLGRNERSAILRLRRLVGAGGEK